MTVVAWDGRTLAADTQAGIGDLVSYSQKLFRVGKRIVGVAGSYADALEFIAWLESGLGPGAFPPSLRPETCPAVALVIEPDGSAFRYENTPYPVPVIVRKFIAIGSGRDFAMAAMQLGYDARIAVATACDLSVSCGGDIESLSLES